MRGGGGGDSRSIIIIIFLGKYARAVGIHTGRFSLIVIRGDQGINSRDIYFQVKTVSRSVIPGIIIHRHSKRASFIGCQERADVLIIMI